MARSMLTPQLLGMAVHWERTRAWWWQQQGHSQRAADCTALANRLERQLFDETPQPSQSNY